MFSICLYVFSIVCTIAFVKLFFPSLNRNSSLVFVLSSFNVEFCIAARLFYRVGVFFSHITACTWIQMHLYALDFIPLKKHFTKSEFFSGAAIHTHTIQIQFPCKYGNIFCFFIFIVRLCCCLDLNIFYFVLGYASLTLFPSIAFLGLTFREC